MRKKESFVRSLSPAHQRRYQAAIRYAADTLLMRTRSPCAHRDEQPGDDDAFLADESLATSLWSVPSGEPDLTSFVFQRVVQEPRTRRLLDLLLHDERILLTGDKDFGRFICTLHGQETLCCQSDLPRRRRDRRGKFSLSTSSAVLCVSALNSYYDTRVMRGAFYSLPFFKITVLLRSTFGPSTGFNPASRAFLIVSSNAFFETRKGGSREHLTLRF